MTVLDDLGRTTGIAGDDRLARQHGLHDDPSERLRCRGGVDYDIAELHQRRDVGAETGERNPITQVRAPDLVLELLAVRVLAKQRVADDQRLGTGQTGQGLDQHVLTLPGGEAAKQADHGQAV